MNSRHTSRRENVSSKEPTRHHIFLAQSPTDSHQVRELLRELYPDLKQLAFSHLLREREGHTLTPTAIVNETYLKLYSMKQLKWIDKPRFLALCSKQMRRILVDYARGHMAQKRGGDQVKVTFYEEQLPKTQQHIDVETINQALEKLGNTYPELEVLVDLRYFGGLTNKEISQHFGISLSTVKHKWSFAKAWLHKEMVL